MCSKPSNWVQSSPAQKCHKGDKLPSNGSFCLCEIFYFSKPLLMMNTLFSEHINTTHLPLTCMSQISNKCHWAPHRSKCIWPIHVAVVAPHIWMMFLFFFYKNTIFFKLKIDGYRHTMCSFAHKIWNSGFLYVCRNHVRKNLVINQSVTHSVTKPTQFDAPEVQWCSQVIHTCISDARKLGSFHWWSPLSKHGMHGRKHGTLKWNTIKIQFKLYLFLYIQKLQISGSV